MNVCTKISVPLYGFNDRLMCYMHWHILQSCHSLAAPNIYLMAIISPGDRCDHHSFCLRLLCTQYSQINSNYYWVYYSFYHDYLLQLLYQYILIIILNLLFPLFGAVVLPKSYVVVHPKPMLQLWNIAYIRIFKMIF